MARQKTVFRVNYNGIDTNIEKVSVDPSEVVIDETDNYFKSFPKAKKRVISFHKETIQQHKDAIAKAKLFVKE